MGKQSRSKKTENLGKGKVTPVQVAFIVDRYLSDNNYAETRSVFRNEASSLISKSPVREAPKSLLSLGAMLDEYICLKEQKVILEQEKARLEQEKNRVQGLLQGMQSVMNAYNASAIPSVPMITHANNLSKSVTAVPQIHPPAVSPPGPPMTVYSTPAVIPVSGPSNSRMECDNYSTPVTNQPLIRKKRSSEVVTEASAASKKTRGLLTSRKLTTQGTEKLTVSDNVMNSQAAPQLISVNESLPPSCTPNEPTGKASGIAKCLFNQPQLSPPTNSSGPKTPPQAVSPQIDKSMTPLGVSTANCSHSNTPREITPTNCTIISTERVRVSPLKQMSCITIERNRCISSSSPVKTSLKRLGKRDHVKSRLDFDGSDAIVNVDNPITNETSTSESEIDADIFDLDLPNLDAFGENFSFSDLLGDLDLGCVDIGYPCPSALGTSADALSGSSHESGDNNLGATQVMSEFSSTITEVVSEKDVNIQGPETVTSLKSITKCIKIVSPAKGNNTSLVSATN